MILITYSKHKEKGYNSPTTVPHFILLYIFLKIMYYLFNWNLETKSCIDVACADNS